jgi:hypothetical protein
VTLIVLKREMEGSINGNEEVHTRNEKDDEAPDVNSLTQASERSRRKDLGTTILDDRFRI